MLDLVSGGRVDFGTGESSSEAELGGFLIEPEREARDVGGRPAGRAALHDARRRSPVTPATYVTMPPRNVVPKPMQKPHPPVWVACSRRDTIHLAAQKGIGALAFAFVDPEEAQHWVDDYYATLETEGVPIGDAVNANVACVTTFMCHDDEETALARGLEGANFFGYSLAHYYVFGRHRPACTDVWAEYQQRRGEHGFDPEAVAAAARERATGSARRSSQDGLRRAARRDRHARPDPRLPAALRGVRRRPGDLLLAGGQEPPRAHHGEPRAVRDARCCPSSWSATSSATRDKDAAARAGRSTR